MYLQLAEGENENYQALAQNDTSDAYIYVPANFLNNTEPMYVRADYFAVNYDPQTANMLLDQLAPLQTQGMSILPIAGLVTGAISLGKKLIENRKAKVAAGTAKPLFKKGGLIDKLKTKLQQKKGETEAPAVMDKNLTVPVGGSVTLPGGTITAGFEPAAPATQQSFFQKNKTLILVGGGLLLVGGIYLATRKRKK